MSLTDPDLERAIEIIRRRPRLAQVIIAVHDMTDRRRTCRVSVDVTNGVIRVFRENMVYSTPVTDEGGVVPSG